MRQLENYGFIIFFLTFTCTITNAQSPISFYPYASGNVWQYRDCVTDEIVYTRYNDSTWVTADSTVFIEGRRIPGALLFEKIDTAYNVFNLQFQPDYPRYRLAADSGESWQAGVSGTDPVIVTVTDVFQDYVFGVLTTVKVFQFEVVPPPPAPPFWLGDDHLAVGFGLVNSFIEPLACLYLYGAIIDGVQWGGSIMTIPEDDFHPDDVMLYQNYPNPFNSFTTIRFTLAKKDRVSLKVYNLLGRVVSILLDEVKPPGTWSVLWNAEGFSSGTYFVRLETTGHIETNKVLIIK